MHIFDIPKSDADTVSDLGLARLRRLSPGDAAPFGTRRYTVPPGMSAPAERHDDLELIRVVSGQASVEVARRIADVDGGGAVLFQAGETHVVHNRSAVEPLVVFSINWMSGTVAEAVPA